jgi:hypothetical protein
VGDACPTKLGVILFSCLDELGNDDPSSISLHSASSYPVYVAASVMALTLEQLDQLLTEWRQKIDRISQNLLDLHGLSTYQRLTSTAASPLTGITQVQVAPILEVMANLFQQFEQLLAVIDRASQLRQQVPRWLVSEQKVLAIEALLIGNSIQWIEPPVPLQQRGLLTAVELQQVMTPEQVLTAMTVAFEQVRDVVLAVDVAWSELAAQLGQAERQLEIFRHAAANMVANPLFEAELGTIQTAIIKLRSQVETDPLGAQSGFAQQIAPAIAHLNTALEHSQRQQADRQARLQQTQDSLAHLKELHQQAIATAQECQEKISGVPVPPAMAPAHLDALTSWLTRLTATLAEGNIHAATVGLDNWMAKTKEYIALQDNAMREQRQLLETRQELRGRLNALQAKALARGLSEDATLTQLALQAKQLLYARPTPLNQAITLVTAYEQRLNNR